MEKDCQWKQSDGLKSIRNTVDLLTLSPDCCFLIKDETFELYRILREICGCPLVNRCKKDVQNLGTIFDQQLK